uniref:Uncharacterized protein n=1 Tax=Sphaerodactylus townsendi TaxID=933632 RepID=A0ACB8F8I0_9SAUR
MVQIVVHSPTIQAEGHQSVGRPGQVVARMVLHREPAIDHEESHLRHGVEPQQHGDASREESQPQQLPHGGILGAQREGGDVLVVGLVESLVQPRHAVVEQVPQEVAEVEEQQADHHVQQQPGQLRSAVGQAFTRASSTSAGRRWREECRPGGRRGCAVKHKPAGRLPRMFRRRLEAGSWPCTSSGPAGGEGCKRSSARKGEAEKPCRMCPASDTRTWTEDQTPNPSLASSPFPCRGGREGIAHRISSFHLAKVEQRRVEKRAP